MIELNKPARFHPSDSQKIRDLKTQLIQEVTQLSEALADVKVVDRQLLRVYPKKPRFVKPLLDARLLELILHPENKWCVTESQMIEIIKSAEVTRECLPDMIRAAKPTLTRHHE